MSAAMTTVVRAYKKEALQQALDVVRAVIIAAPGPLKTKDIHRLALEQPLDGTVNHLLRPDLLKRTVAPKPPNPTHPIRSLR